MGVKASPPFLCGQPCPPPRGGETSRFCRLCGFGFPGQAAGKGSKRKCSPSVPLHKAQAPGGAGCEGLCVAGQQFRASALRSWSIPLFVSPRGWEQVYFYLGGFHGSTAGSGSICSAEGLCAVGVHPLNAIMPRSVQAVLDEKQNTRIYPDIWNLKLLNH